MTEFKITLTGNSNVGKTTMLNVLVFGDVRSEGSTIGASFKTWIPEIWRGKRKMLGIWDTAGQERFKSLTSNYYRNSMGIVYCVNADGKSVSEKKMDIALEEIVRNCGGCNSMFLYLCVTKCDTLEDYDLAMITARMDAWAIKWGTTIKRVYYTSSYKPKGIAEMFNEIASDIDNSPMRAPSYQDLPDPIDLVDFKAKHKGCPGCVV
jgi:small GTP-binding protein